MGEKPAVGAYPCANEAWTSVPAAGTGHKGKGMPQEILFGHYITDDLPAGMAAPRA